MGAGVTNDLPLFNRRRRVGNYVSRAHEDLRPRALAARHGRDGAAGPQPHLPGQRPADRHAARSRGRRDHAPHGQVEPGRRVELRGLRLRHLPRARRRHSQAAWPKARCACRTRSTSSAWRLREVEASHVQLAAAQEALVQSEKLASMGQLAAGIAHEVNNPLGVVLMYAHLLLDECEPQSKMREDLVMIAEQADRCKKIVAGLLHFARQNKVVRIPNDLRELVNRAMLTIPVPDGIAVHIKHGLADPMAEVDRDQIVQVLTNLVSNAVAAMENGRHADHRHRGRRGPRPPHRPRHGRRHPAGEHQEGFRPVFHHQADGQGHGPGPGRDLRHREDAQRRHPRRSRRPIRPPAPPARPSP